MVLGRFSLLTRTGSLLSCGATLSISPRTSPASQRVTVRLVTSVSARPVAPSLETPLESHGLTGVVDVLVYDEFDRSGFM